MDDKEDIESKNNGFPSDESATPEFCDVMDVETHLLNIAKCNYGLPISTGTGTNLIQTEGTYFNHIKPISWPPSSSSWVDGTRLSAFQPYRPSVAVTPKTFTSITPGASTSITPSASTAITPSAPTSITPIRSVSVTPTLSISVTPTASSSTTPTTSTPTTPTTVLTNLQRGNTETPAPEDDSPEFSWFEKAGRGEIFPCDFPLEVPVDKCDEHGLTALMWASSYGQYLSSQLLIKAGASVNFEGYREETPLLLASAEGHLELMRLLIANGANINHTDKNGNTALYYAAYGNYHHCVNELLLHGADLTIKNIFGESPYSVANKRQCKLSLSVIHNYLLAIIKDGEYNTKIS